MRLPHVTPTTSLHRSGKNERLCLSGGWLYTTAWMGMTVSQHTVDEGNLHLFDATLAHTGRQVKRDT